MTADPNKYSKNPSTPVLKDSDDGEDFSSQAVKSIGEVFKILVKALKNLKIYLPNNPVHQRFLKEFYAQLDTHLKNFGETVLTVGQYTLSYDDQVIYENMNRLDSLAFKLFVDGVRQMTLLEGMTDEESRELLEVLGKTYDAEYPDDDLVTLLWQRHFHHIKFQILEDYFSDSNESSLIPDLQAKAGFTNLIQSELKDSQELKDQTDASASHRPSISVETKGLQFSQVFRLTDDEIEKIKQEMKEEGDKDLILEMIGIIYSVLQVEKDSQFFSEMIGALTKNITQFSDQGDFVQVEKITRLFVLLKEQIPPLPENQLAILNEFIDSLAKPECLMNLEQHINSLDDKNIAALANFLGMLTLSAVPSIINILGKAKTRKTRKVLSDILVEFGKKDIGPIIKRLQGGEWFVIRNLVQIIGRIGNKQAIDSLRKLVQYPDERVRKEVVATLLMIGNEKENAREMMLQFLHDHDLAIRKQVIHVVQLNKNVKAVPVLIKMIGEEDFSSRDPEEKHLIFSALGKLGNDDLIPLLGSYLKPTFLYFVKRKKKEEKAICAVHALKHLETAKAVNLLTEAKKHPYRPVSDFAARALFEIQRANEKRELKRKNESE
ncbi:MAG: HEAT repeat domain-containing protein [Nitrospirae bacterium]|nr:HEAT repeat domain-containing protein [Nitrospirota bacterium]